MHLETLLWAKQTSYFNFRTEIYHEIYIPIVVILCFIHFQLKSNTKQSTRKTETILGMQSRTSQIKCECILHTLLLVSVLVPFPNAHTRIYLFPYIAVTGLFSLMGSDE